MPRFVAATQLQFRPGFAALLIVQGGSMWGLAHFELGADFLQPRSKRVNLLLQLPDGRLLFLIFAVLF